MRHIIMKHVIVRTSPKGKTQKFFGVCINCGMNNLSISDTMKECDNVVGRTASESFVEIIERLSADKSK